MINNKRENEKISEFFRKKKALRENGKSEERKSPNLIIIFRQFERPEKNEQGGMK